MAVAKHEIQWLRQLKASQLHQLAIALGSPCSGSKSIIADEINQILKPAFVEGRHASPNPASTSTDHTGFSIISIDMGIQNLAYAHLLAPPPNDNQTAATQGPGISTLPMLRAWDRLTAFPLQNQDNLTKKSAKPEPYIPSRYADAAHRFVTDLLRKYSPTHILIEQQRFRSGGGSAVAEWTIRVGLFESMLHAVLRTLREERGSSLGLQAVVSISPARTARFWLEGRGGSGSLVEPRKITGREGKQAKIDIVAKSFLGAKDHLVETGTGQAKAMKTAFLTRWCATSKAAKALKLQKKAAPSESRYGSESARQPKLDDLADCLLQALAWLRWQKTRELVLEDLRKEDPLAAVQQRLKQREAETGPNGRLLPD